MRNRLIAIVHAAVSVALDTSPRAAPAGASEEGGKPYVAIVSKGFQHQFWQAVQDGAQKAAKEYGAQITFEGPESETEVDEQIQMLQTALDKSPDAIGFAALDSQASIPLMEQAEQPTSPSSPSTPAWRATFRSTTAATDNKAAAALAAKKMAELIGGRGQGRARRARPDQHQRYRPPRRVRGVHEAERARHRDRRHPVRRR